MLSLKKLGLIMLGLNVLGIIVLYSMASNQQYTGFNRHAEFLHKETFNKNQGQPLIENASLKKEIETIVQHQKETYEVLRESNPFYILGAYPEIGENYVNASYGTPNYGYHNDDNYCEIVDIYNLAHQENMFKTMNFFTDAGEKSLVRSHVMQRIGNIYSEANFRDKEEKENIPPNKHFDHRITNFFLNNFKFHTYHKIGQHFLCATQIYNHIPGHSAITSKQKILDYLNVYSASYANKKYCFDKDKFSPPSYRLYNKEECEVFFDLIQSSEYDQKIKNGPIMYLIKIAGAAHKSEGVFLLDDEMVQTLSDEYNYGESCGEQNKSFIAQTYISNPLLLINNKFDFRVFMLIASTNPLIVYYHDGFLRVSLNQYDNSSKDKATHITNSALVNQIIRKAKLENGTAVNMTADRSWDFKKLQDYLLENGKIKDPNWLDNYLRPSFKKAFVHLMRMASKAFLKQSNVYALQGVDFLLDDNLNLWFLESNSSPFLNGKKRMGFFLTMLSDLFEIQYSYYRSRMKRVLKVIRKMQREGDYNSINLKKWRKEYEEAVKNRLEPEYKIRKDNTFSIVIDENLPGSKAYFGYLSQDCL